jgi:chromosome partitioning protein
VDMTDVATGVVREWISAAYGAKVLPVEIPSTRVASTTSTEFGTVYDVSKYEGSKRTYERAKVAYDRLVELIEQAVIQSWNEQLSK